MVVQRLLAAFVPSFLSFPGPCGPIGCLGLKGTQLYIEVGLDMWVEKKKERWREGGRGKESRTKKGQNIR